jgi:hypothetical protein
MGDFPAGPVHTVGELIARLRGIDPATPLLVSGYEGGFTAAVVDAVDVVELDGLPSFYGQFQTEDEAAHLTGPHGPWRLVQGGTPPTIVGEPVTAVVLSRVNQDG